jgi:tripartite ATP-independent transporter DctP family solute receptor
MNKEAASYFCAGLAVGILTAAAGFAWMLRTQDGREDAGEHLRGQLVLKLGHSLDTTHPVHAAMEFMKRRLEELSGGAVTIDIYPGEVLGSETEVIEQLQHGALAMTKTSSAPMEGFVPEMGVFSLPYVFRDAAHYWRVLDSELGRSLLLKSQEKNLRGLCYYDAGSRNFYTKSKPILHPDDLTGMKIRVMNSRTSMDMVTAMGAAPTPIAWGELYTALQQGTVDGAENNPPSFYTSRHFEVCKAFSLNAHTRIPDILLISTKIWETLPAEVQGWVQQAADESSVFQRDLWREKTVESLEEVRAAGVEVVEPDLAPFVERVQPMLAGYAGTPIGALLEQIRAMGDAP